MFLPKRKRERSGIERAPKREWPRHRRHVASFVCSVMGCGGECHGQVRAHHLRSAANAGTGLKPHDSYCVGLCDGHHEEFHRTGIDTFMAKYGIDLWAIARRLARTSPVPEVREFAKSQQWNETI